MGQTAASLHFMHSQDVTLNSFIHMVENPPDEEVSLLFFSLSLSLLEKFMLSYKSSILESFNEASLDLF